MSQCHSSRPSVAVNTAQVLICGVAVLVGVAAFGDGHAVAQISGATATAESPRITAIGTGEVMITPDRAVIYIGIQSSDDQAVLAASATATARAHMIDTLLTLGFSVDSIPPNAYTVAQDPRAMGRGPAGTAQAFIARASFQVVVQALDRLDEVIDAILWSGVADIPAVLFQLADKSEARRVATAQAVARARATAAVMAESTGGRLGRLIHLANQPFAFGNVATYMNPITFGSRTVPTVPSDLTVRVSVQGVWEFVPRDPISQL